MQERADRAKASRGGSKMHVLLQRKHYLLAASLVFMAFAVGAFVAFYVGQARGRQFVAASHHGAVIQHSERPSSAAQSDETLPKSGALSDPRARLAALAREGNAKAELLLGLQLLRGDTAAPDQPEGARWIRAAAEQHDAVAEYHLGSLYEHGEGVSRGSADAIRWYQAAARQGNRKAMHALGIAYAQGQGIEKNYSEAAHWFSKAAELGLVNSQFNLAVLYERGLGVRQNLLDAYKWYAVAATNGDQESGKRLDALKTQLGVDDVAAGERAAQTFTPGKGNPEVNDPPVLAALLSRPH